MGIVFMVSTWINHSYGTKAHIITVVNFPFFPHSATTEDEKSLKENLKILFRHTLTPTNKIVDVKIYGGA